MLELKTIDQSPVNRQLLRFILTHQGATRQELVKQTGLKLLTVSKAVTSLIESGLVIVDGTVVGGMGRRQDLLKINPEFSLTIGVDIGYSNIKIGVVSFDGQILVKVIVPGYDEPIQQGIPFTEMMRTIHELIGRYGADHFLGIGASISGMVDFHAGRVIFCPNILGFDDRPLGEEISAETGLPVILDTSARCMALGEFYFGAGKGIANQMFVSLGIGTIAAGIITGGRLYRGANGFAGEIGHNQADAPDKDTNRCSCGGVGCLELYATQSMACRNLGDELSQYTGYSPAKRMMGSGGMTGEILRAAYNEGDAIVVEHVDKIVRAVAMEISSSINLINPALVTLGGGFIWNVPELVNRIEQETKKICLVPMRNRISICMSTLGESAAIQGSALQVIHHYLAG